MPSSSICMRFLPKSHVSHLSFVWFGCGLVWFWFGYGLVFCSTFNNTRGALCLVLHPFWSQVPTQAAKLINIEQHKLRSFALFSIFWMFPHNSAVRHLVQPCKSLLLLKQFLALGEIGQNPKHDPFHDPYHIFDPSDRRLPCFLSIGLLVQGCSSQPPCATATHVIFHDFVLIFFSHILLKGIHCHV